MKRLLTMAAIWAFVAPFTYTALRFADFVAWKPVESPQAAVQPVSPLARDVQAFRGKVGL